jgi:hypothetical protein
MECLDMLHNGDVEGITGDDRQPFSFRSMPFSPSQVTLLLCAVNTLVRLDLKL